jgi:hypothetical protein
MNEMREKAPRSPSAGISAAWVYASFAFSRAFSARSCSVSRSARDNRAVVADVFAEPFAGPAGTAASFSATTAALYSAVKLRRVGRGAGSTDPDPSVSDGCLLLPAYASPVTPRKPTPIAGVSHDILTGTEACGVDWRPRTYRLPDPAASRGGRGAYSEVR